MERERESRLFLFFRVGGELIVLCSAFHLLLGGVCDKSKKAGKERKGKERKAFVQKNKNENTHTL